MGRDSFLVYSAYQRYVKAMHTAQLEHGIVLEGPDEVGKSSLADYMGDEVADRSWLTNRVYRHAMPKHDWSSYASDELVPRKDDRHLVILLPEQPTPKHILAQVKAEHGYAPADYQAVVDLYASLPWLVPGWAAPWESVAMICWQIDGSGNRIIDPDPLYISNAVAGKIAKLVITAAQASRYRIVTD